MGNIFSKQNITIALIALGVLWLANNIDAIGNIVSKKTVV